LKIDIDFEFINLKLIANLIEALRGRFMRKRKGTAQSVSVVLQPVIVQIGELVEIVDPDELQLKDELNKEWVQAWCKEVNKRNSKLHKRARKTQMS